MAAIPGMKGDVYFGDAERPLPDWRKLPDDDRDPEDMTMEEKEAVIGMIGFDPSASE